MDQSLWALSFYQQQPEFVGGVQIVTPATFELTSEDIKLGTGDLYVETGPIMHIEWLKDNK